MSKYRLVPDYDGNNDCELSSELYEDAIEEALDYLGYYVVKEDGDEQN